MIIISQTQSCDPSSFSDKDNFNDGQGFHIKTSSNSPIISINSNYDLNQTAASGNGTVSNPYIIEGLTINGNGSLYCILINNTNKFFNLRGCVLFNSSYGVYFNNVSNGELSINQIFGNINAGLFMESSFNNSIFGNSVYKNLMCGFFVRNCSYIEISGNDLERNSFIGIFLNMSNFNDILLNSISYHQNALLLESSNYSSLIFNKGINNGYGIRQINCIGNILSENLFTTKSNSRDDSTKEDIDVSIVDFTMLLLIGIFGLIITYVFLRKLLF